MSKKKQAAQLRAAKKKRNQTIAVIACCAGVLLALILALVLGKNSDKVYTTSGNGQPTTGQTSLKETGTLDPEKTYYADIVIKDYGTVVVKLDQKNAPVTASNFVDLAKAGFYDGLTFHRIMKNFMMQGGCPNGDGYGGSDQNILGEFTANGVENPLSHTRGAIAMARSGAMNSASSQFFIVHQDSLFLDGDYAVFGYVTEGIEVVDAVCNSAKPTDGNGTIPAKNQPVIEKITIHE